MFTSTSTDPGLPSIPAGRAPGTSVPGHGDGDDRAEVLAVAPRAGRVHAPAARPDDPEAVLRVERQRHVGIAADERAAEVDPVARRRAAAERNDDDARRVGVAREATRGTSSPSLVRDERDAIGVDAGRLQRRRARRGEIGAEPLVDERPVRGRVRVERDLHEAGRVDCERLRIAAAPREDVLHELAVQAAEDVDEAVPSCAKYGVPSAATAAAMTGPVTCDCVWRARSTSGRRRSTSGVRPPARSGSRAGSRRSAAGRAACGWRPGRRSRARGPGRDSARRRSCPPPASPRRRARSLPA